MKTITVALIGAGSRGKIYTDLMLEENFKVVAVADPVPELRAYMKETHGIPEEMCFDSWEDMFKLGKIADMVVVATSDTAHYEPTMAAINLGYDILLEKPVAPTEQECADIANTAKEKGVKILVCHVLRYTNFFRKIKEMIDNGELGQIISIHHNECVGNVHQSHSYVRGNWHKTADSSCMLLAKCCHDMDILQWLMGSNCTKVQSFGSLTHFTRDNAPEGSPEYCIEGCPHGDTCYYNAVKLYLEDEQNWWFRNAAARKVNPTNEEIAEVLRTSMYGKCVYKCDNDVVDHQVVNMEFENGGLVSFNMCCFNYGGRHLRIMGTDGEIFGDMDRDIIEYFSFKTREYTTIHPNEAPVDGSLAGGHGGGDGGLIHILYKYLTEDYNGDLLSEIGISVKNHFIAFAAEKSRLEGTIVDVAAFEKEYLK